jgi:lipoyl-dependent peroxiredoxin
MRFNSIFRRELAMTEKLLFTGKTHNTNGPAGGAHSSDGHLDVKLPAPHPAAEQLFGAAWSACYMGAIELAATQRKIKLPAGLAVDAEIDLNLTDGAFFLRARLNVSVPGVEREQAQALIDTAHKICPYSKAVHGNIDVTTTLV